MSSFSWISGSRSTDFSVITALDFKYSSVFSMRISSGCFPTGLHAAYRPAPAPGCGWYGPRFPAAAPEFLHPWFPCSTFSQWLQAEILADFPLGPLEIALGHGLPHITANRSFSGSIPSCMSTCPLLPLPGAAPDWDPLQTDWNPQWPHDFALLKSVARAWRDFPPDSCAPWSAIHRAFRLRRFSLAKSSFNSAGFPRMPS